MVRTKADRTSRKGKFYSTRAIRVHTYICFVEHNRTVCIHGIYIFVAIGEKATVKKSTPVKINTSKKNTCRKGGNIAYILPIL